MLWRLGRADEAIQLCRSTLGDMSRALMPDAKIAQAYRCLGDAQIELGDNEGAALSLDAAVKLGDDPTTYSNLGNALRLIGDLDKARYSLEA